MYGKMHDVTSSFAQTKNIFITSFTRCKHVSIRRIIRIGRRCKRRDNLMLELSTSVGIFRQLEMVHFL